MKSAPTSLVVDRTDKLEGEAKGDKSGDVGRGKRLLAFVFPSRMVFPLQERLRGIFRVNPTKNAGWSLDAQG